MSAALGYSPAPGLTMKEVETIASHCNDRKLTARTVSEASDDMFFGVFIKVCLVFLCAFVNPLKVYIIEIV